MACRPSGLAFQSCADHAYGFAFQACMDGLLDWWLISAHLPSAIESREMVFHLPNDTVHRFRNYSHCVADVLLRSCWIPVRKKLPQPTLHHPTFSLGCANNGSANCLCAMLSMSTTCAEGRTCKLPNLYVWAGDLRQSHVSCCSGRCSFAMTPVSFLPCWLPL